MCACVVVLVFFFKQKTAYEMRISDWSSDVCSSDLSVASIKGEDIAQSSSGSFESLLQGRVSGLQVMNRNNDNPQGGATVRVRGISSINGSNAPLVEIGREACRERVCQYV